MSRSLGRADGRVRARTSVPREQWISPSMWSKVLRIMPIPCVDVIFQREDSSILYGWRLIKPYNNVWALPGGRILHREHVKQCAGRIAKHYGLRFEELYSVGVFPVNFPNRSDISITVAALKVTGEPKIDGFEFSKFAWKKNPPKRLGTNYARMITKWHTASKSKQFLKLNRLWIDDKFTS